MNFGNTLEEQYAKVSAINRLLEKYCKVFSGLFYVFAGFAFLFGLLNSEIRAALIITSGISVLCGIFGGRFLGKMYGWAWICFCEKYNPKGLAKSLSKATHNSAVEGYIFGGSSGATAAVSGVAIVFAFLLTFYIWKGFFYMIKYRNLPQKEKELKKQLEKKQAETSLI